MTDHTRDGRRLSEVSHTHPYTNESFGATQTYTRGRIIAADGGEARAVGGDAAEGDDGDDSATTERDTGGDTAVESAVEPADDDPDGGDDVAATSRGDDGTLGDVDHTPPRNAPSANPAYMPDDENDER